MKNILITITLLYAVLGCNLVKNQLPLVDQPPKLLQKVTNGQKYIVQDKQRPDNYIYIARVKGTPYEMGKAFGQMFSVEIAGTLDLFYGYYIGQLKQILEKKVPMWLTNSVDNGVEKLAKRILDLNYRITKIYTNSRYYQEIKGIADGAKSKSLGKEVKRLNLFPQLIKAACTVAGLWKNATLNHQTLHVRALDWDYKNPISKYPTVVVYHPSDPKLQTHANFGWAGFVGSLTGMSTKLSLGEKVWYPPKHAVKMTRYGNPWTYVFRDLMYEATNMKQALALLSNTHRTCAIHIGLATKQDHSFRMFEYSQNTLNNYDDTNYTNYAANHPKKQGLAYFDKHVQPSGDSCVGQVLTNPNFYGKWNAESVYRYLGLSHETGDTQLAVFDLENQIAYISYSKADGSQPAYRRSPIRLDMGSLFESF